jgi:hypothetical protein
MKKIFLFLLILISIRASSQNLHVVPQYKNTAPTIDFGIPWWNNGFTFSPNSNNAFVWDPGLFLMSSQGNFVPLTIETNIVSASLFYGDSWTANHGLSGASNGFVNKTAYFKGWGVTNNGVDGSTINSLSWPSVSLGNNQIFFHQIGINDMRTFGYAGIQSYIGCYLNLLVWKQSGDIVTGQNGSPTTPANWKPYTMAGFGNSSICNQTTTNSSPITFKLPGNSIYVSVGDSTTGPVTWSLTIDGVSKGTFTAVNSYGQSFMPDCRRFTNLTDTMHTVVMQKTGGTGAFIVVYVASNYAPRQPFGDGGNKSYVTTVGRMTTGAAGVSGYANFGGSDTAVNSYNSFLSAAVWGLSSDGLAVNMVDYNRYYNPKLTGNVQSDSLHPTDQGDTYIAESLIDGASNNVLPQDRDAARTVQQYVTVDGVTGASFANSYGTYTPIVTNVSNLATGTPVSVTHYMRVGNEISVDGAIICTFTSTSTQTQVGVSFPTPSNISSANDCLGGVFGANNGNSNGIVNGDITNHRAQLTFTSPSSGGVTVYYHFTFTVKQ